MQEFMMIFRMVPMEDFQPSEEDLQESIKEWQNWIGGIAAQGKFTGTNQLGFQGKTLKPGGVVTDGPYAELKEIVGGYLIIKATDLDEALEFAKGCPILSIGGHVEIRDVIPMGM
jgi:hypothetical protein